MTRRARSAAKKAGVAVVKADDPTNVSRREKRKNKTLQDKLRQAVDQLALDHNVTVEDVLRSNITPKMTPNIHRAVEGNRVNTMIAASVDGYDTLSAYDHDTLPCIGCSSSSSHSSRVNT